MSDFPPGLRSGRRTSARIDLRHDSVAAQAIKTCCAKFYAGAAARLLLGDSFHPGGDRLTVKLGRKLHLGPADRVLDVACGDGHSALVLAGEFGCSVVGVDFSPDNIRRATQAARAAHLDTVCSFAAATAKRCPLSRARSARWSASARSALFQTSRRVRVKCTGR